MDDEIELVELKYPFMWPIGCDVKVIKIIAPEFRSSTYQREKCNQGIVTSHRTHHGIRWNRVELRTGSQYDFLTKELQKSDEINVP